MRGETAAGRSRAAAKRHDFELDVRGVKALRDVTSAVELRLYVWRDSGEGLLQLGGRYKGVRDSRKSESDVLPIGKVN